MPRPSGLAPDNSNKRAAPIARAAACADNSNKREAPIARVTACADNSSKREAPAAIARKVPRLL